MAINRLYWTFSRILTNFDFKNRISPHIPLLLFIFSSKFWSNPWNLTLFDFFTVFHLKEERFRAIKLNIWRVLPYHLLLPSQPNSNRIVIAYNRFLFMTSVALPNYSELFRINSSIIFNKYFIQLLILYLFNF